MFIKIRHNILNRAINFFLENRRSAIIPDIQDLKSVFLIVENDTKKGIKEIENQMNALFGNTHCHFIILCQQLSDEILQNDKYCEITVKDFGFWGLLKPQKKEFLSHLDSCQMLINLTNGNKDASDYISSIMSTTFRVTFRRGIYSKIYDLILDIGHDSTPTEKLRILHDYLSALNGKSK